MPVYALDLPDNIANVSETKIVTAVPAKTSQIDKYFIDKAPSGSRQETGDLHIIYNDGTEIIEKIAPKLPSTESNIVYNQEAIGDVAVAQDKRTIAWTEQFDNCCTSYSIPLVVSVYRSGKTILHIQGEQAVWYWTFFKSGKEIAIVWGPTHGSANTYQLFNVTTGRQLSVAYWNADTQVLDPDAPKWAKQTEKLMNSRKI